MSTIQNSDEFVIQRSSNSFKQTAVNLMSTIQDTDWMLIQRGSESFKVTGLDVKDQLGGGGTNTPPVLGSVTLVQNAPIDANRFTNKSFTVEVTSTGGTAESLGLTATVTGALGIKAGSDLIETNNYPGTSGTSVVLDLEGTTNLGSLIEAGDTVIASARYKPETDTISSVVVNSGGEGVLTAVYCVAPNDDISALWDGSDATYIESLGTNDLPPLVQGINGLPDAQAGTTVSFTLRYSTTSSSTNGVYVRCGTRAGSTIIGTSAELQSPNNQVTEQTVQLSADEWNRVDNTEIWIQKASGDSLPMRMHQLSISYVALSPSTVLTLSTEKDIKLFQAGDVVQGGRTADKFSTTIYQGNYVDNNSTAFVPTSIDNTVKSLVWIKSRDSEVFDHQLTYTSAPVDDRGDKYCFSTNTFDPLNETPYAIKSLTDSGFYVGATGYTNKNGDRYVAWNFRAAPGFFDIVEFPGNGTEQNVPHSLTTTPGCIICKNIDEGTDWIVYHKELGATKYAILSNSVAVNTSTVYWNDTEPTATEFTVGRADNTNQDNKNIVAFLFADTPDGGIKCGKSPAGSQGLNQECGFKPGWLLIKSTDSGDWLVIDSARGVGEGATYKLEANSVNNETGPNSVDFNATGFSQTLMSAENIWIAIEDSSEAYRVLSTDLANNTMTVDGGEWKSADDVDAGGEGKVSTVSSKQGSGTVSTISGKQVTIAPFTDNCFVEGQYLTVSKTTNINPKTDKITSYDDATKVITVDGDTDLAQFVPGDSVFMTDNSTDSASTKTGYKLVTSQITNIASASTLRGDWTSALTIPGGWSGAWPPEGAFDGDESTKAFGNTETVAFAPTTSIPIAETLALNVGVYSGEAWYFEVTLGGVTDTINLSDAGANNKYVTTSAFAGKTISSSTPLTITTRQISGDTKQNGFVVAMQVDKLLLIDNAYPDPSGDNIFVDTKNTLTFTDDSDLQYFKKDDVVQGIPVVNVRTGDNTTPYDNCTPEEMNLDDKQTVGTGRVIWVKEEDFDATPLKIKWESGDGLYIQSYPNSDDLEDAELLYAGTDSFTVDGSIDAVYVRIYAGGVATGCNFVFTDDNPVKVISTDVDNLKMTVDGGDWRSGNGAETPTGYTVRKSSDINDPPSLTWDTIGNTGQETVLFTAASKYPTDAATYGTFIYDLGVATADIYWHHKTDTSGITDTHKLYTSSDGSTWTLADQGDGVKTRLFSGSDSFQYLLAVRTDFAGMSATNWSIDPSSFDGDDHVEYQTTGGVGTIATDGVDIASRTITLTAAESGAARWIAGNKAGTEFRVATAPKPAVSTTAHLKFDSQGAVFGYSPNPVPATLMNNLTRPTLSFPATFSDTGLSPDAEFADNQAYIQASVELKNTGGSSGIKKTNSVVPSTTQRSIGPGEVDNNAEGVGRMIEQVVTHERRVADNYAEEMEEKVSRLKSALNFESASLVGDGKA